MTVLNMPLALSTDAKVAEDFFAKHPQVKLVAIQYVTLSGVVCNRLQPVQSFLHAVKTRGGMHQAIVDLLMPTTGVIVPEILEVFCIGRGVFKPDFSTLRLYPDSAGLNNTAVVVVESTCLDLDPRTNLRRIVAEAKAQHKLEFLTGFEIEVAYFEPNEDELFTPAYRGPIGIHMAAATTRSSLWPVVNETTIALADAGIFVESSHKEYGTSQWEYVLPPYAPVESVDAYIFAIETIKNIAQKHGLIASVYPTPYPTEEEKSEEVEAEPKKEEEPFTRHKNGQHVHISATFDGDDGRSEPSAWNPDELMSGILSHLPALMAFGLSQVDSYHRVGANSISSGDYVGWGDHHRGMPVRRLYRNHWELRCHDATSNPYAAVGAFISAALDRKPLTIKPTNALPATLTEEQRKELNLVTLLPTSLEEALAKVEADRQWVESVFGKDYVYWFLANKKSDIELLSKMDVRQRRKLLTRLF